MANKTNQFIKEILLLFEILKFKLFKESFELNYALDFAFNHLNRKPPLWQIRDEITELLRITFRKSVKIGLEIGTAGGGTLFLFSRTFAPDAIMISIDLPHGEFGGGYPVYKIPIFKLMVRWRQRTYFIRANSHLSETYKKVEQILGDKLLDFVFIDGDHTYEGVERDFELYYELVRNGGIIAFHDIVPGLKENVGGVPDFWSKIKSKYNYTEHVKNWEQGGFGIGVIYK